METAPICRAMDATSDEMRRRPPQTTPEHIKTRMANGVASCGVFLSDIRKLEAQHNSNAVNKLLEDAREAAVMREYLRAGC